MTKDGKQNRFGRFIFEDEQAERIAAGDMSAAGEFIDDNRARLYGWARRFWRNHFQHLPLDLHGTFYKLDEFINQIFVDFPFYDLLDEEKLGKSIYKSFFGISCGGLRFRHKYRSGKEISLDTPIAISQRSGDTEAGSELKDVLPSSYPPPDAILERAETVRELAPRYYHEIGKVFQSVRGATIGEILAAQNGEAVAANPFQDVIEEVFFGYSFEEVKRYAKAKRTA